MKTFLLPILLPYGHYPIHTLTNDRKSTCFTSYSFSRMNSRTSAICLADKSADNENRFFAKHVPSNQRKHFVQAAVERVPKIDWVHSGVRDLIKWVD